ncbi:aldehyde dehydrogenase [Klebsiella pneumoniae]|nr:aldehyde dehydrogenase [Klebsiella pneumoniae]
MSHARPGLTTCSQYDAALHALSAARQRWAETSVNRRLALLRQIKDALAGIAPAWVAAAAAAKGLPAGDPLAGEEWLAGPCALMVGCNGLIATLEQLEEKTFLRRIPLRTLADGRLALRVVPGTLWDRLLLSGVLAEIWMQPGVTRAHLDRYAARAYDIPPAARQGKLALVLGAGNVASIAPLDVLHKLFIENQVCLLKLNPVNDYLHDLLAQALAPVIAMDALRIVTGDARAGAWLTTHPAVDEIHITGSRETHDVIVWGEGETARQRRAAGTPLNPRRVTSELGGVSPTIIVPGPWSEADIAFQAQQLATQKMNNGGFNCVASQVLILQQGWEPATALLNQLYRLIAANTRPDYYPGAENRLTDFRLRARQPLEIARGDALPLIVANTDDDPGFCQQEVFGPGLSVTRLEADSAESFLRQAIGYANQRLQGTLGANIVIHPRTRKAIGRKRFNALIAELRYGTVAINCWSGVAFLLAPCPWGAFPGHTLDDIQSGRGKVHNSFMLEKTERTVIEAPFRPFPRSLWHGELTLMPLPPWFITHRGQEAVAQRLVGFYHRPRWRKLPALLWRALRG